MMQIADKDAGNCPDGVQGTELAQCTIHTKGSFRQRFIEVRRQERIKNNFQGRRMLLLVIYILLIVLNLYKRDSRILFFSLLIFLWILFGWSYGNADWAIYVNRYDYYILKSSSTEPLFTCILWIGHLLGLEYRQFLIGLSAICLLLLAKTILDYSRNPGFILALYAIFSFPMDVTQVRFFVASSILWFGFRYLFRYREDRRKEDLAKWLVTVLAASGMHMAACLILLLLIPLHFNRRVTILFTVLMNTVMAVFVSLKDYFFTLVATVWSPEKAASVLTASERYTWDRIQYVWFKIAVIFLGFLIIYLVTYQLIGRHQKNSSRYQRIMADMDFALDCNIIILVLFGFVTITNDFYRLQQIVVMLNYFTFSRALLPKARGKGKVKAQNLFVILISTAFAVSSLYFLVLRTTNFDTVFYPLFFNNVLFN